MITTGTKFKLSKAGPRATIYTALEIHDDETVTAEYYSYLGLGQYTKRVSAPIELSACIELN